MHPRNLHLYFFSPTGGTQRVAGLFAENLNAADACTDITVHAEAKTFSADDCLLVFFPVYGGRVPGPCLARMRALRGTDTPAVLVAVFGNRAVDDALLEMRDTLTPLGFRVIAAAEVIAPTSGDIDLYGRVASMLEVGTGFHPEMTGRENVYLNGAILGMTRAEIDAKMAEIIEFSEVGDFIDTPVKRYSSGMFVKLAFSVAAHLDSEIMIMDEVLAVGDMKFQKKCLTKMRQAARRDGKTVLYVSHNMATIRDLCDRCIVLDKGKVIFDGDVDEGIALYLSTKSQAADFVDYSDFKRDNWFKRDNLRLQSVRVLVPSVEAIERTQPVRIHCVIKAQESVERVGLRLEVRDEVGNPLATSCLYDLNLHEGDSEFTAQYDLSVLSPGKYSNYFTLFTAGEGGAHTVEDWVPGIQFRMVDTFTSGHLEWNAKDWGSIRLPEAVLCKENAE